MRGGGVRLDVMQEPQQIIHRLPQEQECDGDVTRAPYGPGDPVPIPRRTHNASADCWPPRTAFPATTRAGTPVNTINERAIVSFRLSTGAARAWFPHYFY